jgi:PA domain
MAVPSPNVLLAMFIVSFSLSAVFHRSVVRYAYPSDPSAPAPPSIFTHYSADIVVPSTNDTFRSRPAAFGSSFEDEFEGELIRSPGDGLMCEEVPPSDQIRFRGKIILLQRGQCSFAAKTRNVQRAGAIAAIVGDNTAGSGLLTMYAKGNLVFHILKPKLTSR